MDNEAADSVSTIGRGWCRRSSAPELKCTTSPEVELQTGWNQSEPSTRSEGKEATTGMSFRHMEKKPVLDGSDRRPEAREFRVRSPEFITRSRESEQLAALPLNIAETGRLQKVAEEDMEGEGKNLYLRCAIFTIHPRIWESHAPPENPWKLTNWCLQPGFKAKH
ncbi:hypothetical protein B0H19DRAFT_1241571 [Mycena capillaripes]|nr:hypothetical protein B0H19DRAFT_1241571 [Mycena capillaripes]